MRTVWNISDQFLAYWVAKKKKEKIRLQGLTVLIGWNKKYPIHVIATIDKKKYKSHFCYLRTFDIVSESLCSKLNVNRGVDLEVSVQGFQHQATNINEDYFTVTNIT